MQRIISSIFICLIVTSWNIAYANILIFTPNGDYVNKPDMATFCSSSDTVNTTAHITSALTAAQSNILSACPANRKIIIDEGGSINNTTTFQINGSFEAGIRQVFGGSGAVIFGSPGDLYPQWFGVKGDGTTDDYAALTKTATTAVASGQRTVKLPNGTFMVSQPWQISGFSVEGSGIGSVIMAKSNNTIGVVLLDNSILGYSTDGKYSNFRIVGNSANVTGAVYGLMVSGNALYNTFDKIRINDVKGPGVIITPASSTRPTLNTFTNVHVDSGLSDGWTVHGGKTNTLINCAAEEVSGTGFNFIGDVENPEEYVLISPYTEKTVKHGLYAKNTFGLKVISPLIQDYDYGQSGTVGHGIWLDQNNFTTIDSASVSTPTRGTSYTYVVTGGSRNKITNMASNATASNISIGSGYDISLDRAYSSSLAKQIPLIAYNATTIAANTTTYIMPSTGVVGTEPQCQTIMASYGAIVSLFAKSAIDPTGVQYYSAVVYKNGVSTGLTLSLSTSNYTSASSHNAEVDFAPGDTISIQLVTSSSAPSLTAGAYHVTMGILQ